MAEPVSKLVLAVVRQDCCLASCPYRYGDDHDSKRLEEKVEKKLKHRVADGNEVRALEKRVKELEGAISRFILAHRKKIDPTELVALQNVLNKKGG